MKRSCLLAAVLCSMVSAAAAQTASRESRPTIRATTSEVVLDIAVRNKQGKPIRDLKPGDIQVLEDGVPQELRSFRFVRAGEARSGHAAGTPGASTSASRALPSVNPICIVLHNLDPVSRHKAMQALEEFLQREFPGESYLGVFSMDYRLSALHPFTRNRKEVLQAAKAGFPGGPMDFARAIDPYLSASPNRLSVSASVDVAGRSATVAVNRSGGEVSRSIVAGADVNTGAGANALRGDKVSERAAFSNITGRQEMDKINTMLEQLSAVPGRKTILLVTTGLTTTGDPVDFDAMVARATSSGSTIYALDVTEMHGNSTAAAANIGIAEVAGVSRSQGQVSRATDTSSLAQMKQKSLQGDNMKNAVRASDTQAGLRALSESTGGFLIANTSEYRKPFERIVEDIDAHYEAVYRPASEKNDGRFHRIEVKVNRQGLVAETRPGYYAMPGGLQPFEAQALAALNSEPLPRAVPFHAAVLRFGAAGESRNTVAIELPGTALTPRPVPERKAELLHATVLALVKDADGNVVDKFSVDSPYEVPDANLAQLQATPITYTHPVPLPPGRYTLEAAVLDRAGQRSGVSVTPFEVPAARTGLELSSVILVDRIEPAQGQADPSDPLLYRGNRIVPLVSNTVKAEAKPFVYFVVYPNAANQEKPRLTVEFLTDGKVVANQVAALPAAEPSGAVPMMVRAVIRPGRCEFRFTVAQGSESVTRSVVYTAGQ